MRQINRALAFTLVVLVVVLAVAGPALASDGSAGGGGGGEPVHPLDGGGPIPTVVTWVSPGWGPIELHFTPKPGEPEPEYKDRISETVRIWKAYFPTGV